MSPLFVGLISGEFPPLPGGMGDYTRELANALHKLGVQPWVLTSGKVRSSALDLPFAVLPHITKWNFSSLAQVASIIRKRKPEILHLQYQAAAYGMSLAIHLLPWRLRLTRPRPKLVVTFHDLRVPYLFPKAGPLRPWALKVLARGCEAVIATNPEDQKSINSWGLKREAHFIPIGSNIPPQPLPGYSPEAWRRSLGVNPQETLVSYFGFLNQSKGGEDLIRALHILKEKGIKIKLLMVGAAAGSVDPTDQAYALKVKGLISQLGVEDMVIWTGFEPAERVSGHLLASDLCVLPYRDGVSFRRGSLMAALAHGLPIVSTMPGTENRQIVDGENMALVPPQDPQALANKIEVLATDPGLRERLAQGAKRLSQGFSWDRIAEKTLAVYQQLLPKV